MEKIPENQIQEDEKLNISKSKNNQEQSNTFSKNIINNPSSSSIFNNNMQSIKTITGTITAEYIDDYVFTQQFYHYNNHLNDKDKESDSTKKENAKKFRQKLKKTRELYNDPKSSNFAGPWAKYKDEINFEAEKEQIKSSNNIKDNNQDNDDILAIIEKGEKDAEKNKKNKNDKIYEDNPDFLNPDEEDEKIEPKVIVEYDQGLDYMG